MSLKSLIQRLLDSRTTVAEAAHSAMPKPETPTIVSDFVTDKTWHSLIAPFDGYFSCKGITKHMLIENSAAQWSGVTGLTSGGYMGFTLPMSKGSEVRYQLDHNSTGVMMTFSKTIGGGYNYFVRRALSCLRALSNYLPRCFCKAKNLGFQNNQLLSSIRALISLAQAPRISLVTSLRATAGQLLDATQIQSQLLKSKSRTGRWHLLPFLTETLRELESVVTLKKGHRLSSCVVAEVQPIILFGSTRQVQTFNPLTGGALC